MLSGDPLPPHALQQHLESAWPCSDWSNLTVLVAASGGADSTALLRGLAANRRESSSRRLVVAHFNHRWRGADSEADEQFVRQLAETSGFRCEVGRASHTGNAEKSEESARDERYAFLLDAAHRHGARYVAVAHTLDDQAETILFRLLRGTGLSGLTGMPAARALSPAVTLIRPLLGIRRSLVLDYLAAINQPFREDRSNVDRSYARNRLRHEVIPVLQEFGGADVVEQLAQLGRQASEVIGPLKAEAARILDAVLVGGSSVRLRRLSDKTANRVVLREMFVELWRRRGWPRGEMNCDRWEELATLYLTPDHPPRMFPGGLRVSWREGELVFEC